MVWITLGVAVVALFFARSAAKRAAEVSDRFDTFRREVGSKQLDAEELQSRLGTLNKFVAAMAAGRPVTAEMVKEGRLYEHASVDEIQAQLDEGRRPYVVDVRSEQEWSAGHIEGAVHVPVDEVEKRLHEIARDGRPMYVICAGGGRSQVAAEFLANRGYLNVHNVTGGMNAWRGEKVRD